MVNGVILTKPHAHWTQCPSHRKSERK